MQKIHANFNRKPCLQEIINLLALKNPFLQLNNVDYMLNRLLNNFIIANPFFCLGVYKKDVLIGGDLPVLQVKEDANDLNSNLDFL